MTSTIREDEKNRFSEWNWHDVPPEAIALLAMVPSKVSFIQKVLAKAKVIPQNKPATTFNREFPLAGYSVLDVGCGGGFLAGALARAGAQVVGIDITEDHIKRNQQLRFTSPIGSSEFACAEVGVLADLYSSKKRAKVKTTDKDELSNIKVQSSACLYYPWTWSSYFSSVSIPSELRSLSVLPASGFDIVVSSEVIEHVDNPALFAAQLGACTRPGGVVVLTTPNRNLVSYAVMIVVGEKILKFIRDGTHHFNFFIRKDELTDFYCKPMTQRQPELSSCQTGCPQSVVSSNPKTSSCDSCPVSGAFRKWIVGPRSISLMSSLCGMVSRLPGSSRLAPIVCPRMDRSRYGPLRILPEHDDKAMALIKSQRGRFSRVASGGLIPLVSPNWSSKGSAMKWTIVDDRFGIINYFIAFKKEF